MMNLGELSNIRLWLYLFIIFSLCLSAMPMPRVAAGRLWWPQ